MSAIVRLCQARCTACGIEYLTTIDALMSVVFPRCRRCR